MIKNTLISKTENTLTVDTWGFVYTFHHANGIVSKITRPDGSAVDRIDWDKAEANKTVAYFA